MYVRICEIEVIEYIGSFNGYNFIGRNTRETFYSSLNGKIININFYSMHVLTIKQVIESVSML